VYCGNACQAATRRNARTKLWLETGEAWIDGRRNHYIREYLAEAQSGSCAVCGGAATAAKAATSDGSDTPTDSPT